MAKTIKYVGLDVHKNSISIAIADQERDSEVSSTLKARKRIYYV